MVSPTDLPVLLQSDYADVRGLAQALLGLDAAILVVSLTFPDRTARPGAKLALIGAWSSFLVAIAVMAVAVCGLVLAAERGGGGVETAVVHAYGLLLGAGLLSMLGLSGLFIAAVLGLRLRERPQRGAQSS